MEFGLERRRARRSSGRQMQSSIGSRPSEFFSQSHETVVDALERDLAPPPRFGRRAVLVSGSPNVTPQSIQDVLPSSLASNRFAVFAEDPPKKNYRGCPAVWETTKPVGVMIEDVPVVHFAHGVQHHPIDTPMASENEGFIPNDKVCVTRDVQEIRRSDVPIGDPNDFAEEDEALSKGHHDILSDEDVEEEVFSVFQEWPL